MNSLRLLFVVSLLAVTGCKVVVPGPLPEHAGPALQRDAGHALLLDTLKDEARVGGLLSIKTVPPETATLIRRIATTSERSAKALESLFAGPPPIDSSRTWLPLPEIEARDWIANRTTIALLGGDGRTLEVDLILSQLKVTDYIAALAAALSKNEPSSSRRDELDRIRSEYVALHSAFRSRLGVLASAASAEKPSAPKGDG